MKRHLHFVVSCVLLLTLLALAASADREPASSSFRTEVSVAPASPGAFVLRAKVTDLVSGDLVAMPTLKVPVGEEATAESGAPGAETAVSFSGKVDTTHQSATYTVRVERSGRVVSEHSANLALHSPAATP